MSDPHAGEPQLLPTTTLVLRYGYSSIIFCYFRLAHKLDDRSSSLRVLGQDDTLAWTVVLHVCRHWRRAAYQCSEFWERIPLSSAKWAKVALEYSKPRTIIVEWKSGSGVLGEGYISVPAVLLALKELPRIRVLSLKELSFTIHEGHETRWGLSPAIVQDLRFPWAPQQCKYSTGSSPPTFRSCICTECPLLFQCGGLRRVFEPAKLGDAFACGSCGTCLHPGPEGRATGHHPSATTPGPLHLWPLALPSLSFGPILNT
ncbi:hypothetical protein BC834DRAFT_165628 [Gloeopeniophorella convolvens]|nr:hypothetical protein BC834DRAFT_165628 [Gloeopeniophorella convolvens]